jgi:lysozyme
MRNISQTGINLIKSFEGCRLTAYKPVRTEKYYTIGYGSYGAHVTEGMTITQQQADELLVKDLARYVFYVNDQYHCPVTESLNQNQFDALCSFTYNCGNGGLRNLCKGRTIEQIAEHIPDFNKAGGEILKGLVRRRKAEVDLYNTEVEELPSLDKWVAKTIVNTWLKPSWNEANDKGHEEDKKNIRTLGNKLRLACGMKEDE